VAQIAAHGIQSYLFVHRILSDFPPEEIRMASLRGVYGKKEDEGINSNFK